MSMSNWTSDSGTLSRLIHMPLSAGDKLGNYEIVAPLGAGGMGEVCRARDPKLNLEAAIEVLPDAFANDAQYGIEQGALVMELVEGADTSPAITVVLNWNAGVIE